MTLEEIFGEASQGEDLVSRAATSARIFIRSHMQLTLDSEGATGRRLTAREALDAYGLALLETVVEEGGVGVITDASEPAKTLSERRRKLRLSKRKLAQAAQVSVDDVTNAETPGEVVPFRTIERLAQALALDERKIGLAGAAHGDHALGTRLRELRNNDDRQGDFITTVTDAAWVVARQSELSRVLGADRDMKSAFGRKNSQYGTQIWRQGYSLAERTREILGLEARAPIENISKLAQDTLGIPVIDTGLSADIAGATVLVGSSRGIVLNTEGANRNILVRRMTIAHELGHLLWDPDNQLEAVRVDDSADLGRRDIRDAVEARANAFAIALLAPLEAVRALYAERGDFHDTVAAIADRFGITALAAAHHLANVCDLRADEVSRVRKATATVTRKWEMREIRDNLLKARVPSSRGNRFALLTMQAVRKNLITLDTAASWLKIEKHLLTDLF